MKRVLYFIGHYDYLIYGLLHESPLTEEDTTADFIVLETKNSAETVRFLQKKASGGTELGRFALVNDEAFLDKASMEDTLAAVISAYKKIFERFGLQPGQYAHIYLSFDEWNSFGIYLEHCKGLPPVTVFLRDVNQPSLNIYSYLDSPGKYHFSQLQRKYRVLSGEAEYITDYIVLDEDNTENRLNRRPVQSFSLKGKINGLDRDKFGKLCEFFHAEPEKNVSLTDDGVLLVMDSYWFEQPKTKGSYDYVRMYLTFLDYAGVSGHRAVLKQHPRYSIPEVLRENFANIELIDGYIPVELFAYEASPEFNGIYSIGNTVPKAVFERAGLHELLHSDFVWHWNLYARLDWLFAFCQKNGYRRLLFPELSQEMADICRHFHYLDNGLSLLELTEDQNTEASMIVLWNVHKEGLDNVMPWSDRGVPVVILNPEFDFSLTAQDDNQGRRDSLSVIRLRRYAQAPKSELPVYEQEIFLFSRVEKQRKQFLYFQYQKELPFSGIRIRSSGDRRAAKKLAPLTGKVASKEYLWIKAHTSRIILYGASQLAYKFLKEYGADLNIRFVAAGQPDEETDYRILQQYEVLPFQEELLGEGDYIIVCQSFLHNIDKLPDYALTRDNLLRMKYKVCQDFVYYKIFDAVEKEKKIMLFCGYCELGGTKQILDLTSAADRYCMLFYHIGRETMREAPGYDDFVATSALCDILVHAPLIVNKGVMDADVLQLIPETAVKIFIPQISFRGYAPYKDVRFTNRNYGIQLFGIVRYPFLYRMHMVNSMIIKGKTNEQIIAELKREDYFSEAEIKSNLEEAFRILQVMDAKADVPIFDFIRENYQKELLFKDCIHANDVVLFEYARRLSSYLGEQLTEEINEVEETCKRTGAYFQVASEEPVLPCVAKVLELNFATPDRLYMEKITEERIRMRTLEEWFGDYCDYFRAVLVVKHTLNPEYKSRKVTIYRPEEEKYSMERETEQW